MGLPFPCASMSAFLSAALTKRSVDTRRSSRAFIASFRAVLISSRSTAMAFRKVAPDSCRSNRPRPAARSRLRPSMTEKQPAEAHSKAADPQATQPKGARAQASWVEPKASALLVLADGTVFEGCGLGATGRAAGEVCFNTAMTGYEEILTDPSYAGQIITFTFPHIGNVGTNEDDIETVNMAATPGARGVILRTAITDPSNYRATKHLDQWLKARGIIGLSGIDTRPLTPLIRSKGMPNAVIAHNKDGNFDLHGLREEAREWPGLEGMDLVPMVTCGQRFTWDETPWVWDRGFGRQTSPEFNVVAVDYGIKRNILRLTTG